MCFVLLSALTISGLAQNDPQKETESNYQWDRLHPAFKIDSKKGLQIFENGQRDAKTKRDASGEIGKVKKGIGRVRTTSFHNETVSWLYGNFTQLSLYWLGFESRKKYWDEEDVAKLRELIEKSTRLQAPTISFAGSITLLPSFKNNGSVVRRADPKDISDVRVVLQVGDRIYQPVKHPGALEMTSGEAEHTVVTPYFISTSLNFDSTYRDNLGKRLGTASTEGTINSYQLIQSQEGYSWYAGNFLVEFCLFNKDGSARITEKDKEITVIVIYGASERKATYRLDDIIKLGQ
jgi:hypothetical protein